MRAGKPALYLYTYTTKARGYPGFCVQGSKAVLIVHMTTIGGHDAVTGVIQHTDEYFPKPTDNSIWNLD